MPPKVTFAWPRIRRSARPLPRRLPLPITWWWRAPEPTAKRPMPPWRSAAQVQRAAGWPCRESGPCSGSAPRLRSCSVLVIHRGGTGVGVVRGERQSPPPVTSGRRRVDPRSVESAPGSGEAIGHVIAVGVDRGPVVPTMAVTPAGTNVSLFSLARARNVPPWKLKVTGPCA